MNTSFVFRFSLLIIIFSCITSSNLIGTIQNATLITNTTRISVIVNGTIINCLCQALIIQPSVIAVNYFSANHTCGIFTDYGSLYQLQVRTNPMSTVLLIKPLPPRPASNVTWLLNSMSNKTNYIIGSVSQPQNLYIDNYNRLVTHVWLGNLVQMNRYTLAITNQTNLVPYFTALSYNNGIYYVGIGALSAPLSTGQLITYNSTTLTQITTIISSANNIYGYIRQCAFARNNTLMIVISQPSLTYSRLLFYQINSSTSYTLLNIDITTPYSAGYNIIKANDTFFYLILYAAQRPIYTLKSSIDGLNWTLGIFNKQGPMPTLISSVALDPNGRLWAVDQDCCINIYDTNTGALLGTFNNTPNPYSLLISNNYDFYIGTTTNKIYRIPSILQ